LQGQSGTPGETAGKTPARQPKRQALPDHLRRVPSHLNSRIDELLPHRWQPQV
jgi:hypothetical protein